MFKNSFGALRVLVSCFENANMAISPLRHVAISRLYSADEDARSDSTGTF